LQNNYSKSRKVEKKTLKKTDLAMAGNDN